MNRTFFWGLALPLMLSAENTHAHQTIEEVVITASPHGKKAEDIPGAIAVLDGAALQQTVAATLGETLQNQVGMANSSFGPGVGLPVMRGLSGPRVQVLQNNTAVADVSKISPDHAVGSEPLLADRIEILRGPATLRYGPGAIGGVINIIDNSIHTEAVDGFHGAVETRHSSSNDENVVVGKIDGGLGNLTLHLSGVNRDSNAVEIPGAASRTVDDPDETTRGYIANTDAKADNWTFGASWVTDNLVIGGSISQLDNNYGIPPGSHIHSEEEHGEEEHGEEEHGDHHEEEMPTFTRIDLDQTTYQGKVLLRELDGFIQHALLDLNKTDYEHRELEIEDGASMVGTLFKADSKEARLELTHRPLGDFIGTLGLHFSDRDMEALGEEAFIPPSETTSTGIYLIEDLELDNGNLELGLRYDNQEVDSPGISSIDHDTLNLSASWLRPLADNQRLGLVISRTERAPSAEELLANGEHVATRTFEIGDPELDTESAWNVELNWRYTGSIESSISLYHRQFSDFIYGRDTGSRFSHDLEEEGATGQLACSSQLADFDNSLDEFDEALPCLVQTQEDARFTGLEAEATLPIIDNHSLRLWGDLVRARLDDGGDVPRIPPARIGASWQFEQGPWHWDLNVLHAYDQNRPGENQASTEGYTRLDTYLSYTAAQWKVFLKGSNLTDREIRNATSFLRDIAPEAGRSITVGGNYYF